MTTIGKYLVAILMVQMICLITTVVNAENATTASATPLSSLLPSIRVRKPLSANFTRRVGERIRLECEFELADSSSNDDKRHQSLSYADFTLYWVKNYQELLHPKKNYVQILRKNLTSM